MIGRPAPFGHFKAMVQQTWRFEGGQRLSRDALDEIRRKAAGERARRDAEALAQHEAAADLCRKRWAGAGRVNPRHAYLVAKGIDGEGLRQVGDLLLVPMLDPAGVLWNVQTIAADGTKRFAKGARQKGLHLLVGDVVDRLAIAEGYGTAAVIRRATRLPVAVAFSVSNLVDTAKAMRARFPHADIIIGADDDSHLVNHPQIKRNLGLEAAHAAARAVCGRVGGDGELLYQLAFVEDAQLLTGTGTDLLGIFTQATAFAAPLVVDSPQHIDVIGAALLQQSLTDLPPDGVVLHPSDWMRIALTQERQRRLPDRQPAGRA